MMIVCPDDMNAEERRSVALYGYSNINRWSIVFDSEEEANQVKRKLEELITEEE